MSRDYRALRAEILAGPRAAELAPFVVLNGPKDPDYSTKDAEIASRLSAGRKQIAYREIDEGEVVAALGIPAGPVFLRALWCTANTDLPEGAQSSDVERVAVAWQAWRALEAGKFSIGSPVVRAAINAFVDVLLTAEQATAILALAESDDVITAADVSIALRNTEG